MAGFCRTYCENLRRADPNPESKRRVAINESALKLAMFGCLVVVEPGRVRVRRPLVI